MKANIKKIAMTAAAILIVCAIFALLFIGLTRWGLGGDKRGYVVAEYDGIYVYEADINDLLNYIIITRAQDGGESVDLEAAQQQAIRTVVQFKVLELNLEENGHKIDEAKLEKAYEDAKAKIEETMTYKEWMEKYHVSKDFLEEDVRRAELQKLYNELFPVKVTETEVKNYYNTNALSKYAAPAGYYWTSVVRPVKDITDAKEAAEAKAEMDAYLAKVKDGSMTLEQVDEELKKYDSYSYSIYEGDDILKKDGMTVYADEAALNEALAKIDAEYADRDPNAEVDSEKYVAYMNYLAKTFQAKVFYALQHMEVGSVWGETLYSFPGYYIISLERYEDENKFKPLEEVRDEIIETLTASKQQNSIEEYISALEPTYNVEYCY